MKNINPIKALVVILILITTVVSFEIGYYLSRKQSLENIDLLSNQKSQAEKNMQKLAGDYIDETGSLNDQVEMLSQRELTLKQELDILQGRIAGMFSNAAPFKIPSDGTLATYAGTFGGNMRGFRHLGIDIWTTTANNGKISIHKGNPVYAACSGKVTGTDPSNGALTILCDPIQKSYEVPQHNVFTYYAHMGSADSKELYFTVNRNQRVSAGQLIGYQGDLSSYFPDMRNVHLHFSIFTGSSETDKKGGALNPCLYIGGDCSKVGREFKH